MAGASPSVTEPIERSWVGGKVSGDHTHRLDGIFIEIQLNFGIFLDFDEILKRQKSRSAMVGQNWMHSKIQALFDGAAWVCAVGRCQVFSMQEFGVFTTATTISITAIIRKLFMVTWHCWNLG
jgi:hypothetical protein